MRYLGEVKHLLHEYDLRPRRKLGQSFCVDKELMERMIVYSKLCKDDTVLEIGAGFGFLTRLLSDVAKRVIAVEFDPKILKALTNRLKDRENVTIIPGNILEVKLPSFNKVVANPPYSISSPLIMLLFKKHFDCAVLTLQKEFAEKLKAQEGTREYGPLTVIAAYKARVEILEHLPRASFYPIPGVESVIILIRTREPKFNLIDRELFFRFVKFLFTQRIRKAKRPLESFLLRDMKISKPESRLIIRNLPFIETRVSDLSYEKFVALSKKVHVFLRSQRITYKGYDFYVFPEVYEPSEDTFLLAEHLDLKEGENVLDMGAGCGLLGIIAAERARRVIAVDINPHALECVKFNSRLNHVAHKVDIISSNLFEGFDLDAKFDFIAFNPPYLPVDKERKLGGWLERAWDGGASGRKVIDKFLKTVDKHIAKRGKVLMVQSSLSDPELSIKTFRDIGFRTEVIAEKELFFEKIVVIRAVKSI